jgi:hypothetical protein
MDLKALSEVELEILTKRIKKKLRKSHTKKATNKFQDYQI